MHTCIYSNVVLIYIYIYIYKHKLSTLDKYFLITHNICQRKDTVKPHLSRPIIFIYKVTHLSGY